MAFAPPSCEKGHKTEYRPRYLGRYMIGVIVCPTCKMWRPDAAWRSYCQQIEERLRHGEWRRYRTWPAKEGERHGMRHTLIGRD